ncbi:hypothetical protein DVS77_33745 [Mycolicibacterium moriokaense]|nr:hypothetical protein DVS77_33745 [Mycolicibacterium moriokaense]
MFRSETRTAVLAAVGAALMSTAVACSSDASTTNDRLSAGPNDSFMQCMTDHGVPAPPGGGPGGPGGPPPDGAGPPPDGALPPPPGHGGPPDMGAAPPGVDQQTWDSARQACASLAPEPPPGA